MSSFNTNKDAFASLRHLPAEDWIEQIQRMLAAGSPVFDVVKVTGDPRRGVEIAPRQEDAAERIKQLENLCL
jgi:hypothetical protein